MGHNKGLIDQNDVILHFGETLLIKDDCTQERFIYFCQ